MRNYILERTIMNEIIKQTLSKVIDKFKSGDIPKVVALVYFPTADLPSNKWSFTNRMLMYLSDTEDARGFNQWKQVNRHVKKGSKAVYILVPFFKKQVDEDSGEEKNYLKYFKAVPVFRYEDTEGEPIDHKKIQIPDLPLLKKAKDWNITVKAVPGNYKYKGYFLPNKNEIGMATSEELIFFHELAHVAHKKLKGELKTGQDPLQEIVAELSAQTLCHMVGKQIKDTTGNSYKYIESYSAKVGKDVYSACLEVLNETEKVLNLILSDT